MFGYRDIVLGLRDVGLNPSTPALLIGPATLPDDLRGGVAALLTALGATCNVFLTPTFTYQTMVIPSVGPEDNGLDYAADSEASGESEFYKPALPSSPENGPLAEAVRLAPGAVRSQHPILSFAGINARSFLEAQTLEDPFGPIDALARAGGDVVLMGAEPAANVALHLAEARAGRKQFVRWALTPGGVVECMAYPGCTVGFTSIVPRLLGIEHEALVGGRFFIRRTPLRDLLHETAAWIREDPRALLCDRPSCLYCAAVRKATRTSAPQTN